MSDPVPAAKPSNVALIASLCLNLILIGVIAMGAWRAYQAPPPPPMEPDGFFPMHALMRLAPDKADAIHKILDAHRDRLRALHEAAMKARADAHAEIADPNFNQAKFDAALVRVQVADQAFESELLKMISECVAQLSPEERKAVAEHHAQHPGTRWHRHGERHKFQN